MRSPRPIRRQAANRARYDLSAAWLNEYLIEEGSDDNPGGGIEGDINGQEDKRYLGATRAQSHMGEDSGDDSDSDEYKEEEDYGPGRWQGKRRRSSSSEDLHDVPRKKPKHTRRIKQAKTDRISRSEIQSLVEYIRRTLDWEEAAISSTATRKPSGRELAGQRALKGSDVSSSIVRNGATVTQSAAMAAKLREHWTRTLSKRIVAMYGK